MRTLPGLAVAMLTVGCIEDQPEEANAPCLAAQITDASIQGRYMVFADGMLFTGEAPDERRVEIGTFYLAADHTLSTSFAYYDRNASLPAYQSATLHNQMDPSLTAYRTVGAPGVFQTPQPTGVINMAGTWTFSGDRLSIQLDDAIREWVITNHDAELLQPIEIRHVDGGYTFPGGFTFYSLVGYGYLTSATPSSTATLTAQALATVTSYEHYHMAPADAGWRLFPSVYRPASAWQVQGNADVVSVTNSSAESCNGSPMATYDGMLFNLDGNKDVFYSNDGHDYNCDGYFNDGGHIKRWLAVREGDVVRKTVFIEYSSTGGGYVSVGRWTE